MPFGGQTDGYVWQQTGVQGTLGGWETLCLRWVGHEGHKTPRGGGAGTWVALRVSTPPLASLFHFPTPNALLRHSVDGIF